MYVITSCKNIFFNKTPCIATWLSYICNTTKNENKLYIFHYYEIFGNDMPKEVQLRFQHWFLQTEDSLEKREALHKIWDGIEVKADEKTRRKYTKLNARIDLAEGNRKYFAVKRIAVVAAMFLLMLGSA